MSLWKVMSSLRAVGLLGNPMFIQSKMGGVYLLDIF